MRDLLFLILVVIGIPVSLTVATMEHDDRACRDSGGTYSIDWTAGTSTCHY